MTDKVACKDCGSTTRKIDPRSGPRSPRCVTCMRAFKKKRKAAAHEKRVQKVYGLSEGEYQRLYEYQEGLCPICERATGKTRRLAVEHSHSSGVIRMLACGPCNKLLGHLRDDPAAFRRAAHMLEDPPAVRALGVRMGEGKGDPLEIWRDIPDFGGWYQASNQGRVRSWISPGTNQLGERNRANNPHILTQAKTRGNYLFVGLSSLTPTGYKITQLRTNRLVLLTFVGQSETADHQACHINGDHQDNRLENLYWGTPKQNSSDQDKHGTRPLGELKIASRLTDETVRELRTLWDTGQWAAIDLGIRYGVSGPTAWKAAKGVTWKHVV